MKIRAEASPASLAGREASPPCSVFVRMHGIYALNCSGFAAEIKKRASIHITILSVMYGECLVRVTYYILTIKCLWAFVKFFILLFPTFLPFTLLPACAYTAQAAQKYTKGRQAAAQRYQQPEASRSPDVRAVTVDSS